MRKCRHGPTGDVRRRLRSEIAGPRSLGTKPEFPTAEGERVMGFCNCNGIFYCASSRHIYQRIDGSAPAWKEIYFCPQEINPCGIRGLSAVPNPAAAGEVLLFVALSKVRRLDPADGFKETVELDTPEFLTRQLGVKVTYVLAAYNEFLPYTMPRGETVRLFGFECCHPAAVVHANPRIQARRNSRKSRSRPASPATHVTASATCADRTFATTWPKSPTARTATRFHPHHRGVSLSGGPGQGSVFRRLRLQLRSLPQHRVDLPGGAAAPLTPLDSLYPQRVTFSELR